MPAECQAELLEHDWCPQWASLPRQGAGTRKSRYEAYRCWAKGLGIKGIRVDMPPCVKALIAASPKTIKEKEAKAHARAKNKAVG